MSDRFFVESPISGQIATLGGAEARHLIKAMRVKVGDPVVLFDGSGFEFQASVTRVGRNDIDCQIQDRAEVNREPVRTMTFGVALPKGDRQRWLVEKCVELGVSRLVPLITDRSVAKPTSGAVERLRRYVIEASKQCGRNRLMKIDEGCAYSAFIENGALADSHRWIADPQGDSINSMDPGGDRFHVVIGPEGGLDSGETALARQAGWQSVSLGSRILRVETACAAMASWIGLF